MVLKLMTATVGEVTPGLQDPLNLGALLERHGVRPTARRIEVLAELSLERDDATAQELWSRLRRGNSTTGLATVYRTLALLTDAGVVDVLSHHSGEQCYRLCGEAHHHHLVCERCHRVVEVENCDLDTWADKAAKKHGFVATDHRVEISGVCSDCR